ncbi:hypothetical protein AMES_7822 [Amycolatopsis mediterranei S699]|uniref:Uncharacterized protein n=2 Tax=Amycolatopsis mediterranei TaxID=33910 RepID=A0A0H3DFE8_AMYMU|nr:hypothetical protein [Amycolatopsis mediterranei]ADJ49645.1 hypothetical protein AMED_7940 [Amycolatopsis mediterranei U32]AEK46629.1 hypothetical protein RAM_40810 [Amycolatopsis mediterranei S699]AFO81355.1 hypothetical protein AMES_7822 [Amycolatopsis mediterranei S699]AGT88483.1 hypothetical protein B737_7822 [Amycolatopsis mediterranei RB]KDO08106.1 hypothetical protein DV26_27870 [Amycolatopsis mediterranei]
MQISWRPLDHAEYRASSWFPGLTGLRALAALAVVFFHYGGPVAGPLQGWIAVQLPSIAFGRRLPGGVRRKKGERAPAGMRQEPARRK